jgi:hypothetical protein
MPVKKKKKPVKKTKKSQKDSEKDLEKASDLGQKHYSKITTKYKETGLTNLIVIVSSVMMLGILIIAIVVSLIRVSNQTDLSKTFGNSQKNILITMFLWVSLKSSNGELKAPTKR